MFLSVLCFADSDRSTHLSYTMCQSVLIWFSTGGYLAHSLAIMTDAAHLLTDFGSMMVSLFSLWISSRPPTKTMNFGWHRSGQNQTSDTSKWTNGHFKGWINDCMNILVHFFIDITHNFQSNLCRLQPTLTLVPPAGKKFHKCSFYFLQQVAAVFKLHQLLLPLSDRGVISISASSTLPSFI